MSACRCLNKFPEQRVSAVGPGFEFRMKLDAHIEGAAGELHRFHQAVIRRSAGKDHAMLAENIAVAVVEFIAMAVALLYLGAAISRSKKVPGCTLQG